jgi:3-dehydroquinate synthase
MKKTLWIRLKQYEDRSYPIVIGTLLLPSLAKELRRRPLAHSYALISDSTVMRLYGKNLLSLMQEQGLRVKAISFPAGEANKNRRTKARLEDRMLKLGFGRDSCIIALGGGVTGDLAGYVAATYQRGIPFIQIPTTLLAMVDASVGGKTGIDLPAGKNLLGAFYQPKRVYISLDTLDTLAERQFLSGLAEVIKSAIIRDQAFFSYLEKNYRGILSRDKRVLGTIVKKSCAIKAAVVEADEYEEDLRRILNYGHTIGHALEAAGAYRIPHGFAVSLGMALEGKLACELGFFPKAHLERQNRLLKKLGLPVSSRGLRKKVRPETLLDMMKSDKKVRAGRIEFVLPLRIGKMKKVRDQVGIPVPEEILQKILIRALK